MSVRWRIALAALGLVLACLSAMVLAYALTPSSYDTEQVPVAPTLFVPPQSLGAEWGAG
jgi:hypothetical protein